MRNCSVDTVCRPMYFMSSRYVVGAKRATASMILASLASITVSFRTLMGRRPQVRALRKVGALPGHTARQKLALGAAELADARNRGAGRRRQLEPVDTRGGCHVAFTVFWRFFPVR